MGHRANLIVVRDGRYDLRYSHWAANTLPRDLFWGPDHGVAFTEAQPAAGDDGWLDNVWAEGGSVINTDARVFRLFGGEDLQYDVPLRRLYLALLAAVWQGWDVGWAHEGIADLADHAGYPRDRVLTAKPDEGFTPDLRPPEQPDWVDFVGSVRLSDGRHKHLPLAGNVADCMLLELRTMLLREPGRSPAETVLWFAEHEREAGKTVEVNPNALRDDRVEYPLDGRARILDRAACRIGLHPAPGTDG